MARRSGLAVQRRAQAVAGGWGGGRIYFVKLDYYERYRGLLSKPAPQDRAGTGLRELSAAIGIASTGGASVSDDQKNPEQPFKPYRNRHDDETDHRLASPIISDGLDWAR